MNVPQACQIFYQLENIEIDIEEEDEMTSAEVEEM